MHLDLDRAARTGAAADMALPVIEPTAVPAAAAVRVMIGSDRDSVQAVWRTTLSGQAGIAMQRPRSTGATGLAASVEHQRPGVLLLDNALVDGLDPPSLRRIHAQHQLRVLLLAEEDSPSLVADVLRHGFHGFLLTGSRAETCLKAIRAVSRGELWLSRASLAGVIGDLLGLPVPGGADAGTAVRANRARVDFPKRLTARERQVVALLRQGCINKEIARELGIMEDTVKKHMQSVFAKLGVRRRALVALRGLPPMA